MEVANYFFIAFKAKLAVNFQLADDYPVIQV